MKIVVTGATGFIGFAVAEYLKEKGHFVTAMVRKTSNIDKLEEKNIPSIIADISDTESLYSVFRDTDAVVHCAGYVSDWGRKDDFINANYYGTKNVLDACVSAGVKRLLYTSTVDVFGHKNHSLINEKSPYGKRPGWYGKSKIMAEKLVKEYIRENRLNISIIYPPWVYGEGDVTFVSEIIETIKDGSMLFFRKKGYHTIELCYIKNLVKVYEMLLLNDDTVGESYLVADEPKITFNKFVNTISERIGEKEVKFSLPYPLTYFTALMMEAFGKLIRSKKRPLLTRHSVTLLGNDIVYDTNKLKSIGYEQDYSFDEAIDRTISYYEKNGVI